MFVLGLTGSIGMGKSATARMFADAGVPVYEADAIVHLLYDGDLAPDIEAAFPGTTREGRVDRAMLATQVLGKPEALKRLEGIVHPRVREEERRFLAKAQSDGVPVAVLDIPLLFETGGGARVDAVVVVSAPPDMQRNRVLEREGMSAKKFEAILAQQMPDEEKRKRADFIVDTSKGFSAAREQVRAILETVAKMPQRRD
jgi:dephospho-CoA kinase